MKTSLILQRYNTHNFSNKKQDTATLHTNYSQSISPK